jgi:hypothetical protein
VRLAREVALQCSFLVPLTIVGGGEDSMDGSGVDLGELTGYRELTGCEDGGGVMVSWDIEASTVWRVEDGWPIIEVEADMACTVSWLAGKDALDSFGVDGESVGVDIPPKELGEAIVKETIKPKQRGIYRICRLLQPRK